MADSPAKRKWIKENNDVLRVKLNHHTDADIIEFLKDKAYSTEVKRGLRLLIELARKSEKE